MNNKLGDTTLMPRRRDMMQSGTRDDYNGASLASNIDAMQRGATGTVPLEMKSMTVTESPHDERTIRVSPTQLREAVELKNPVKIAIVIPALNEELGIGKVLDEIHGTLDGHKLRVSDMLNTVVVPLKPEVVVVDGGSTDSTASVTKSHGEVLVRQRGRGYGHALVTGFSYAIEAFDPDVLVMIDADGTYDVADIPRLLLPILSDEADLVLGNRFAGLQPGAMTSTNRIGNRVISWVARHFLGVHVSDTQCGLRALSPDVVKLFNGYANGMSFATEMLADAEQAGARIAEVSIVYRPRIGETKLDPLHDGARILSIIMRLLRDYKPLLFFGGLGFIFALTGLALGVDVLLEWLSTGSVRRIPMTILSVLLFGAGLQLASLGLLADMIKGLRSHKRLPAVPFGKTVS